MTEDGYLTLLGVLAAAFGLLSPVQRAVLRCYAPSREAVLCLAFSAASLTARRCSLHGYFELAEPLARGLQLLAFFFPVVWLFSVGWRYSHGSIPPKRPLHLNEVLREALLSGDFSAASRLILTNAKRIPGLPPAERDLLFTPEVVKRFHSRKSYLHLELLLDDAFFESLDRPLEAVEATLSSQLADFPTPLQALVLKVKGGYGGFRMSASDAALMNRSLENPDWCRKANAHYPLILAAVQKARSGALDKTYSTARPNYTTSQGPSERSTCPVFLAEKSLSIIVEGAVSANTEGDFYLSDFFQLHGEICERFAPYAELALASGLQPAEESIPWAYLLFEIEKDLSEFAGAAIRHELSHDQSASPQVNGVGRLRIAREAVRMFSMCLWNYSAMGREPLLAIGAAATKRYLDLALQLRTTPHEAVYYTVPAGVTRPWGELMIAGLKDSVSKGNTRGTEMLRQGIDQLDSGKGWVGSKNGIARELGLDT